MPTNKFAVGDKIKSTLMPGMVGEIIKINDDGSALIFIESEKRRIIGDLFYWEPIS